MHIMARGQLQVVSPWVLSIYFWKQGLTLVWNSMSTLDWLAGKPQGSPASTLPLNWDYKSHCHVQLFNMGSRDYIQALMIAWHTLW